MNSTVMSGRLTRDPELRYTAGKGKPVCTFSMAVDRPHAKDKTDFFNVVVWNKPGEDAAKYLVRGQGVVVRGCMTTRSYEDKTGQKRWVTELVASEVEFGALPKGYYSNPAAPSADAFTEDGFQKIEDDDDIPF